MEMNYNIITYCNDALIPYLEIGLTAMSMNLKDDIIDFFLMHSRVSRRSTEVLKTLCNEFDNIIFDI